jgi:hypothetical protein
LQFLFSFQYQAQFDEAGAEQELCSIYIGRCNGPVRINRDEIVAWRWISPEALQAELAEPSGEQFTPCFKLEWERIWRDHRGTALSEVGLDPGSTPGAQVKLSRSAVVMTQLLSNLAVRNDWLLRRLFERAAAGRPRVSLSAPTAPFPRNTF